MERDDKPKQWPRIELPSTLKYFAKDHPAWRFAVVVVTLAAWLGIAYISKMH